MGGIIELSRLVGPAEWMPNGIKFVVDVLARSQSVGVEDISAALVILFVRTRLVAHISVASLLHHYQSCSHGALVPASIVEIE